MKTFSHPRKIEVKMEISPEYMDKQWRSHLFAHTCLKLQGKCTKEDGYILRVQKITRIHDQTISRINGMVAFFLEVLADCLLPKIGDKIEVIVDMIFPHGVFCHHQMLRMMMPMVQCKQFVIRQEFSTNSLYNPQTKTVVRKGDILCVLIQDVRFENDLYSCIVSI